MMIRGKCSAADKNLYISNGQDIAVTSQVAAVMSNSIGVVRDLQGSGYVGLKRDSTFTEVSVFILGVQVS